MLWPFVSDKSSLFPVWSLIPQSVHRTAAARLAIGTTFPHETLSISANLWGTWLDAPNSVHRRFAVPESTSSAINSVPPNKPIFLSSMRRNFNYLHVHNKPYSIFDRFFLAWKSIFWNNFVYFNDNTLKTKNRITKWFGQTTFSKISFICSYPHDDVTILEYFRGFIKP